MPAGTPPCWAAPGAGRCCWPHVAAALGVLASEAYSLVAVRIGAIALLCGLLVWIASYDRDYLLSNGPLKRLLVWVGARSYAIYLIHIPAFYLSRELCFRLGWDAGERPLSLLGTSLVLIVVLSELNYRFVESPCRDPAPAWSAPERRPPRRHHFRSHLMLNFLKKIVSPPSPATEPVAAPPAPAPVDPYMLGLRDAVLSGWFNQETDELFSGFPISAEDTRARRGCGDGGNVHFCAMRGARIIIADIDAGKDRQGPASAWPIPRPANWNAWSATPTRCPWLTPRPPGWSPPRSSSTSTIRGSSSPSWYGSASPAHSICSACRIPRRKTCRRTSPPTNTSASPTTSACSARSSSPHWCAKPA